MLMEIVPFSAACDFNFGPNHLFISPSSLIGVLSNLGEINSFSVNIENDCPGCTTVRVLNGTTIISEETSSDTDLGPQTITLNSLSGEGVNGFIISSFEERIISIAINHTPDCVDNLVIDGQNIQGQYEATNQILIKNSSIIGNTTHNSLQIILDSNFSLNVGQELTINNLVIDCF